MSTTPLACPRCGKWIRVAVQAAKVEVRKGFIDVDFHPQRAAHECEEKTDAELRSV